MAYSCYLCGNQYMKASLPIHVAQCEKLWDAREKRPRPPRPKNYDQDRPLPTGEADMDAFNAEAYEVLNMVYVPCPVCQRTFKDERTMMRHYPSCLKSVKKAGRGAGGGRGGGTYTYGR